MGKYAKSTKIGYFDILVSDDINQDNDTGPKQWNKIAKHIARIYDKYNAFIIVSKKEIDFNLFIRY